MNCQKHCEPSSLLPAVHILVNTMTRSGDSWETVHLLWGLSSRALHKGLLCVSRQLLISLCLRAFTVLHRPCCFRHLFEFYSHSASHCLQQAALSSALSLSLSAFPQIHESVSFTACDWKVARIETWSVCFYTN